MKITIGDIRTALSDIEEVRELLLPAYLAHGQFWMHSYRSAWVLENASPTHYDVEFIGTNKTTLEGVYRVSAHLDEQDTVMATVAGVL